MRRAFVLTCLLLSSALFTVPARAQVDQPTGVLYDFALDVAVPGTVNVKFGTPGIGLLTFRDESSDSPQGLVGNGQSGGVLAHDVKFTITPGFEDHVGWQALDMGSLQTLPGDVVTREVRVQAFAIAVNPYFLAHVNATIKTQDGLVYYRTADVLFFSLGTGGLSVQSGSAIDDLKPREIRQASLTLTNLATLPRTFSFALTDNTCDLYVGPPPDVVIGGKTKQTIEFSLQGPDQRLDPLTADNCIIGLEVTSLDNGQKVPATVSIKVQGVYIDPTVYFWTIVIALTLIILILFIRRRKEIIEEEILGKPQKPWTIPVEQVYLRHLKQKDERAWYVVRHYLMEDEYRSALLWYKGYKDATKGARKKERLVLAQERQYEKWRKAWERAIARPIRSADKYEAKLTRKLTRKAKSAHRKEMRAFRTETSKLKAAHLKQVTRANERHAKQAAKAAKKGLPVPEKQVVPLPDFAPQPNLAPVSLAAHKWSKKAGKYRATMGRKQGNLEVKFEKADARQQAKLHRKVARLARKLDDPEFIAEHKIGASPAK